MPTRVRRWFSSLLLDIPLGKYITESHDFGVDPLSGLALIGIRAADLGDHTFVNEVIEPVAKLRPCSHKAIEGISGHARKLDPMLRPRPPDEDYYFPA